MDKMGNGKEKSYFIIESAETYQLGENAPIVKWLESEGFTGRLVGGSLGSWTHTPWLYVDVGNKEFLYGAWSVQTAGPVIGAAHLTVEEFKTIYNIIKESKRRMAAIDRWERRIGISPDSADKDDSATDIGMRVR